MRYVVLGLAPARVEWFADTARWANAGSIPVEFLKVISVAELLARLAGSRPHSALLVDGLVPSIDRDLFVAARDADVPVVVVDDDPRRDWSALGAAAVVGRSFAKEDLVDVLRRCARPVDGGAEATALQRPESPSRAGLLVAVCGPGGTGVSTVAASLACGLASARVGADVVLADLALHAEQGVLHDAGDVTPGVLELADVHRGAAPDDATVRAHTFAVTGGGYRLLLGLRRARQWTLLRRPTVEAAVDSLRRVFDVVVVDCDADVEGEETTGSTGVADRNAMARTAIFGADVVAVVGRPGVKGTHALVRVIVDLAGAGVDVDRLLPVVNVAPRHPKARAETARTLAKLVGGAVGRATPPPLFLPPRRVDDATWAGHPAVAPLPSRLAAAVSAVATSAGDRVALAEPELVAPGSLGIGSDPW